MDLEKALKELGVEIRDGKIKKEDIEKAKKVLNDITISPSTERPEDYGIDDYEWVNGKLNVSGSVDLREKNLKKLPFDFGLVTGRFYCNKNSLTSLLGAPRGVGKDFYCSHNQLTSLQGGPKKVGGGFVCSNNLITSLHGAPDIVGEYFDCSNNLLTSLQGGPKEVSGYFDCSGNKIKSFDGFSTKIGSFVAGTKLKKEYHEYKKEQLMGKKGITKEDLKQDPELEDIKTKIKSLSWVNK
jgi:hypothetical protein